MSRPSDAEIEFRARTRNLVSIGDRPRLTPPSHLTQEAREVFAQTVSAMPSEHFRKQDVELLALYSETIIQSRRAAKQLRTMKLMTDDGISNPIVGTFEKLARLACSLGVKLRIPPSTRLDPKTVYRA